MATPQETEDRLTVKDRLDLHDAVELEERLQWVERELTRREKDLKMLEGVLKTLRQLKDVSQAHIKERELGPALRTRLTAAGLMRGL